MKKADRTIIEGYLKLKIRAVYADLQLIQLKKAFYKACARNSVRACVDGNRIVDLRGTKFEGKVTVREAFSKRVWNYGKQINKLEAEIAFLKKCYEQKHAPAKKSRRIWAVDVYNTVSAHSIFANKVIHKGKIYDKKNIKGRKTTEVG